MAQTLSAAINAVTILEESRACAIYKQVHKHRSVSKLRQETHLVFLDWCLVRGPWDSWISLDPHPKNLQKHRSLKLCIHGLTRVWVSKHCVALCCPFGCPAWKY